MSTDVEVRLSRIGLRGLAEEDRDRNRARPTATRLITTPDTMWSTRNVTVASAWIDANSGSARSPISSPIDRSRRHPPDPERRRVK